MFLYSVSAQVIHPFLCTVSAPSPLCAIGYRAAMPTNVNFRFPKEPIRNLSAPSNLVIKALEKLEREGMTGPDTETRIDGDTASFHTAAGVTVLTVKTGLGPEKEEKTGAACSATHDALAVTPGATRDALPPAGGALPSFLNSMD